MRPARDLKRQHTVRWQSGARRQLLQAPLDAAGVAFRSVMAAPPNSAVNTSGYSVPHRCKMPIAGPGRSGIGGPSWKNERTRSRLGEFQGVVFTALAYRETLWRANCIGGMPTNRVNATLEGTGGAIADGFRNLLHAAIPAPQHVPGEGHPPHSRYSIGWTPTSLRNLSKNTERDMEASFASRSTVHSWRGSP